MLANLLAAKGAFVGGWFVLLFLGERFFRAAPPPSSHNRIFRNAGLWLLTIVFSVGVVAPMTAWGVNQSLWDRPGWMVAGAAGAGFILLDLIILDCWVYWLHRAYHKVPVMWRLHEVHHRDEFLDTTSAMRFHITEILLSASLRLILIAVLAIPLLTVILFETILLFASFFHHSNLRLPARLEKVLSCFVVTPSIHWVHHHAKISDTNSNYAACLSLWDRVFRSKSSMKRTPEMKIGIQGLEDKGFIELLMMPFRGASI
ncbi:MAG: sterol desaturase family protein [Pseudomonadota bacterium]